MKDDLLSCLSLSVTMVLLMHTRKFTLVFVANGQRCHDSCRTTSDLHTSDLHSREKLSHVWLYDEHTEEVSSARIGRTSIASGFRDSWSSYLQLFHVGLGTAAATQRL